MLNGCCTSKIRKQTPVHIDGPEWWKAPNYFREHSKGHDSKNISIPLLQLLLERILPEFFGLCKWQAVFQGLHFYGRIVEALTPSCRLIRGGYNPHNLVLSLDKCTECSRGKVRRAKKDDAKGGVLHEGRQS